MFAIPASMLTWGFEGEAARLGAKAKRKMLARRRGETYVSETSSSSSNESQVSGYGDISTSDEEYMRIIAPDDDDNDADARTQDLAKEEDSRISSLENRIRTIEESMVTTNAKLDLILQKLDQTG